MTPEGICVLIKMIKCVGHIDTLLDFEITVVVIDGKFLLVCDLPELTV